MPTSNKEQHKCSKSKRKVILIRDKNKKERLILTRIVKKRKNVTVEKKKQSYTKTVKEECRRVERRVEYPVFRAQLKERIVPRCLRSRCWCRIHRRMRRCSKHKHRQNRRISRSREDKMSRRKDTKHMKSSTIINDDLMYDRISSDSFSSDSEDEIDNLMESTRKRMKTSGAEWTLITKQPQFKNKIIEKNNNKLLSRNSSLDSLNTLILEEDKEMGIIQKEYYNTITAEIKTNSAPEQKHLVPVLVKKEKNNNLWQDQREIFQINEINAVIIKLEKDVDQSELNLNNLDIKQELYGDI